MWPKFIKWANENGLDCSNFQPLCNKLSNSLGNKEKQDLSSEILKQLEDEVEGTKLLELLEQYDKTLSPTSLYWRHYMQMVLILLKFIRAERTGDWQMHISAFLEMLPWFAHYDHTNYMRWGIVYATDIIQPEISHPDVYKQFMEGDFVVKSTHKTFNQISTDQALEHVNKVGKVAGGLVGITRSDCARDRWCLTYNERSRIVDETSAMFGLTSEDTEYAPSASKDAGTSRVRKDKGDVQKLVTQLEKFLVFDTDSEDLMCLATHDIAPENIKTTLLTAQVHGELKIAVCREKVNKKVNKKGSKFV